jgi:hypothetical protein
MQPTRLAGYGVKTDRFDGTEPTARPNVRNPNLMVGAGRVTLRRTLSGSIALVLLGVAGCPRPACKTAPPCILQAVIQ